MITFVLLALLVRFARYIRLSCLCFWDCRKYLVVKTLNYNYMTLLRCGSSNATLGKQGCLLHVVKEVLAMLAILIQAIWSWLHACKSKEHVWVGGCG